MQRHIFNAGQGLDCERFGFHRSPRSVLENRNDEIGGLIKACGASLFEYSDHPSHIQYIAEGKHKWSYGHSLDDFAHRKEQILIHPDEWSEQGRGAYKGVSRAGFQDAQT